MPFYERKFSVNSIQMHQKDIEASYICFSYMCQIFPKFPAQHTRSNYVINLHQENSYGVFGLEDENRFFFFN